jgi:hypothetical protein
MDIEDFASSKIKTLEQLNLIRDELLKKEFDTIFNFTMVDQSFKSKKRRIHTTPHKL